jgi:glycosyltransferase involved in cell wall biosynthesis
MRIGIDTTPLRLTRAGTARYIQGLLTHVRDLHPVAFGGAGRASVLAREIGWYPFVLSRARGFDVLHCTTYYGPLRPRMPLVVTVHDVAVLRHPEAFPRWTRTYAPRVVPHVLRAATRVIAISEFTRRELVELLRIPEHNICVVPNAVEPAFTPHGEAATGDYVLAVGTLEPRKNLERLVEATHLLGVELRVVGASGWGNVSVDGVRWLGEVNDDELARLYRGARVVAYPSLYEGFGIPVLEAMATGTPVVTSAGGATEEVAGGAAVLVDPRDAASIAAGLEEAATRRDELRALGLERARSFTWEDVARRTVAVYEEARG